MIEKTRVLFCAGGLLLLATMAAAAEPPRRFEITPFAGYRVGGGFEDEASGTEYDLDDNNSFGLIVNIVDRANTQWEFGWSRQSTAVDLSPAGIPGDLDLDIDYFQAGGTYLWDGDLARPFMVATLGAANLDPGNDASSETYFAFSIGGGWKIWPTSRLGLRLEARAYGIVTDSSSKIFCGSNPSNSGCLIQSRGELLWQWDFTAGAVFRF